MTKFFVAAGISISSPQFLFIPFGLDASGRLLGLVFSFVVELVSRFLPSKLEEVEACPWARPPPWKSRLYVDSGLGGVATRWFELLLGVMEREGFAIRGFPEEGPLENIVG